MKGLYLLAKTDLKMAHNNLKLMEDVNDDVYMNYIAYHVQQACEKMLKFLIEIKGDKIPHTHNIGVLLDKCDEMKIEIPEIIKDYELVITEWATGTRYDSSFQTSKRQLTKVMTCMEQWFLEIEGGKI